MAAPSYRCSTCNVGWPLISEYAEDCPLCHSETWRCTDGDPITSVKAREMIAERNEQVARERDVEARMDQAFDGWFLRENGIAPLDVLAGPDIPAGQRFALHQLGELTA